MRLVNTVVVALGESSRTKATIRWKRLLVEAMTRTICRFKAVSRCYQLVVRMPDVSSEGGTVFHFCVIDKKKDVITRLSQ